MSLLQKIAKSFEEHPNVVVYGPYEEKSFENGSAGLDHDAHTVNYVVSPRRAIKSVAEMNDWFKGLIKKRPYDQSKFSIFHSQNTLSIGHMRYDEKNVGTVKKQTTIIEKISDPDFLNGLNGFEDGLRVKTKSTEVELGRMIMIYGAPDRKSGKIVYESFETGDLTSRSLLKIKGLKK